MEVKIGVQHAVREVVIDSDLATAEIEKRVSEALAGSSPLLLLSDAKGRQVMVPSDKLAYVELGSPTSGQVGFRS